MELTGAYIVVKKVDVILPQEIYEMLRHHLVVGNPPPSYYRVTMSLEQVLQGDFFTEYIKRGQCSSNDRSVSSLTVGSTAREHSDAVRGYCLSGQHVQAKRRCVIQCTAARPCSLLLTSDKTSLSAGVLTMYLDKETYERAGLVGKPHGAKGNRGLKPRWGASTLWSEMLLDSLTLHIYSCLV